MSHEGDPPRKEDVVFVHGPAEGGDGYRVVRKRDDSIEIGEMRAVQEGRPLQGELVRLEPRAESERLFDVEVLVSRDELAANVGAGARSGPAQVATDAYRTNWDTIFGSREEPELPN